MERDRKWRRSRATALPALVMLSLLSAAMPRTVDAQNGRNASASASKEHAGSILSDSSDAEANTDHAAGEDGKLVPTGEFVRLEGLYPFMPGGPVRGAELETAGKTLEKAGDTLDLRALRGKLVLLDFWASWCRPCIEEIPETNAFALEFSGRDDFVFISVNQDAATSGGDAASVRDFVRAHGIEYPVLIDGAAPSLKKTFAIRAWPTRIMISPDGEILKRPAGRLTLEAAAEYLRRR